MAITLAAVKQSSPFSASVSGNFWVTKNIYIHPDGGEVRVFMDMYASQAAYLSGASALFQQDYISPNLLSKVGLANLIEPAIISNISDFAGGTFVSGL